MANKVSDNIKKKVKNMKTEFVVLNAALIILGILMIAFSSTFNEIICIAIGIGLCLWGVLRVIAYFQLRRDEVFGSFGLVQGCAMIGFGVYFLVHPKLFGSIIGIALAIILLITAVTKFQYAFDLLKLESPYWWVQFIAAGLIAVCGILAITKPFGLANIIMIFIGISLIASSVWDIMTVLRISHILKNGVKEAKKRSRYIDAQVDDSDT